MQSQQKQPKTAMIENLFESTTTESDVFSDTQSSGSISERIETEFTEVLDSILSDISTVDTKISALQTYITLLDSNIMYLDKRSRSEKDTTKRINILKALNATMDMMSRYQDVYQKFLTVKHSYRKSQTLALQNKFRLSIDAQKAIKSSKEELTISKLIEMFGSVQQNLKSDTQKERMIDAIEELEDEETYSLT